MTRFLAITNAFGWIGWLGFALLYALCHAQQKLNGRVIALAKDLLEEIKERQ